MNTLNPVTLDDLGNFLNNLIQAYDQYIFYAFCLMFASSLLVLTRRLMVGVKQ